MTKDPNVDPNLLYPALLLFLHLQIQFNARFETSLPGLVKNAVEVVCCHSVGVFFPFCVDVWVFACMLIFWSAIGGREPCWVIDNWLGSFMMEISVMLWNIVQALALLTLRNEAGCSFSLILLNYVWSTKKSYYLLTIIFRSSGAKLKWGFECREQASPWRSKV